MILNKYRVLPITLNEWKKTDMVKFGIERAKRNALLIAKKKAVQMGFSENEVTIKEDVSEGYCTFICEVKS